MYVYKHISTQSLNK